ncbi:hypothetical protein K437DRAFT_91008 [Tilletiaria anomala UBC 951]|uniref:Expansin-like EG45 domain-containing protein n=1 Tax=Tilletiaria anomala (strain ATCC 24038 / CBS 436.72 / UBC 951) TaxID=1037660 RepID=A0A066V7U9_TILAU|nr:uncharacterized protein K437DRAFT_91008 [Tilletiaria anomala UBC 951]KDN34705.1 hypothetical protein K437DRAFT_91008 [Tilletiaria anomala UBC 951]
MSGVAGRYTNSKEESDDPVVYVAPGTGACGITYTDDDFGACLKPGWVNSANVNGCNKWIQATSDASGISVYVRVVDACGASSNTTFGCNDLFLTKAAFTALAGSNSSEALQTGHLPGNVSWEFTNEPCGFCAMGYPGKLPCSGENDPCIGPDHDSVMRPGRLNLTAADSAAICRSPLTSMTKVKASASISSCS